MPTAPLSTLPEKVNPGDLITADLINAILAALRGSQRIDERFASLSQEIIDLKTRVQRIEDLLESVRSNNNDLRGRVDQVFIDRDDILAKIRDLNVNVIPGINKHFDDIQSNNATRFTSIKDQITDVRLRTVQLSDPIDLMPGLNTDTINVLKANNINSIGDLKAPTRSIAAIIGNDLEVARINNLVGQIRG
jgi:hypothetical protein